MNQGLYLFLFLNVLNEAGLFKMVRKALLKNNQASSTDGMRSLSFQDTPARSIRKACSLKCFFLPEEQRRSRIRVWLKVIRTGRVARSETESKGSRFLGTIA